MKLTIHRGTREIGGSCVQIEKGKSSILLDAGLPLGESPSGVDLAKIDFSDVFISHPHQDHFGLIENLAADKTVHIGETARQFIAATRIFLGKSPLTNAFNDLYNRTWVNLEPGFRVMPYLMDHSCIDAFGFLVEADGKRLYYSGDFRAHGRRNKAFDWFLNDPPRDIDVLLLEGTMMGRGNASFVDEKAVEQGMLEALRTQDDRACFLVCSGQHIDRLCAAYRAAKRAGRIFVIDIYTGYILRIAANRFPSLPDINSAKDVRVLTKGFTAGMHYSRFNDNREFFGAFARDIFQQETMITIDEILAQPKRYLLKVSYFNDLLKSLNSCSVIFSMWTGNLDEPKYQRLKQHPKITFHEIHTSGHAVREDLQRFAAALKPKRLIPIHTERADEFESMFDNVTLLCDGETLEI
ncbi:MAG: MBL fold metallo-hydrolase RNA specificity domain-containing protein [Geobacteraceae bacterium]|nr:MBL fold metallo-hydrolase RNA specificity domain-containing protein [Geobacteraceae bacterium]